MGYLLVSANCFRQPQPTFTFRAVLSCHAIFFIFLLDLKELPTTDIFRASQCDLVMITPDGVNNYYKGTPPAPLEGGQAPL